MGLLRTRRLLFISCLAIALLGLDSRNPVHGTFWEQSRDFVCYNSDVYL